MDSGYFQFQPYLIGYFGEKAFFCVFTLQSQSLERGILRAIDFIM